MQINQKEKRCLLSDHPKGDCTTLFLIGYKTRQMRASDGGRKKLKSSAILQSLIIYQSV
jgi:hypothetical protein